jgi:hypothetical protein
MRRERMVSRIAKYHQDLADTGEITGKWAKFIIKLYNVNEEGKATEWPTNDIPEWMKTIETKQELSPANATALTKWLQNGSEVVCTAPQLRKKCAKPMRRPPPEAAEMRDF